jgi:hypothetical protein
MGDRVPIKAILTSGVMDWRILVIVHIIPKDGPIASLQEQMTDTKAVFVSNRKSSVLIAKERERLCCSMVSPVAT